MDSLSLVALIATLWLLGALALGAIWCLVIDWASGDGIRPRYLWFVLALFVLGVIADTILT